MGSSAVHHNSTSSTTSSVRMGHPESVIVSGNRFNDIAPYVTSIYEADPQKWGAMMPWDFPQKASRQKEEAFLNEIFGEREVHLQGGRNGDSAGYRFLKQVYYTIAIWNVNERVPAIANWWWNQQSNKDIIDDSLMLEHMCKPDAQPETFFGPQEIAQYGRKTLDMVVRLIQKYAADHRQQIEQDSSVTNKSAQDKSEKETLAQEKSAQDHLDPRSSQTTLTPVNAVIAAEQVSEVDTGMPLLSSAIKPAAFGEVHEVEAIATADGLSSGPHGLATAHAGGAEVAAVRSVDSHANGSVSILSEVPFTSLREARVEQPQVQPDILPWHADSRAFVPRKPYIHEQHGAHQRFASQMPTQTYASRIDPDMIPEMGGRGGKSRRLSRGGREMNARGALRGGYLDEGRARRDSASYQHDAYSHDVARHAFQIPGAPQQHTATQPTPFRMRRDGYSSEPIHQTRRNASLPHQSPQIAHRAVTMPAQLLPNVVRSHAGNWRPGGGYNKPEQLPWQLHPNVVNEHFIGANCVHVKQLIVINAPKNCDMMQVFIEEGIVPLHVRRYLKPGDEGPTGFFFVDFKTHDDARRGLSLDRTYVDGFQILVEVTRDAYDATFAEDRARRLASSFVAAGSPHPIQRSGWAHEQQEGHRGPQFPMDPLRHDPVPVMLRSTHLPPLGGTPMHAGAHMQGEFRTNDNSLRQDTPVTDTSTPLSTHPDSLVKKSKKHKNKGKKHKERDDARDASSTVTGEVTHEIKDLVDKIKSTVDKQKDLATDSKADMPHILSQPIGRLQLKENNKVSGKTQGSSRDHAKALSISDSASSQGEHHTCPHGQHDEHVKVEQSSMLPDRTSMITVTTVPRYRNEESTKTEECGTTNQDSYGAAEPPAEVQEVSDQAHRSQELEGQHPKSILPERRDSDREDLQSTGAHTQIATSQDDIVRDTGNAKNPTQNDAPVEQSDDHTYSKRLISSSEDILPAAETDRASLNTHKDGNANNPKIKPQEKVKGPGQTESLSIFGKKQSKPKKKDIKIKGSIKQRPVVMANIDAGEHDTGSSGAARQLKTGGDSNSKQSAKDKQSSNTDAADKLASGDSKASPSRRRNLLGILTSLTRSRSAIDAETQENATSTARKQEESKGIGGDAASTKTTHDEPTSLLTADTYDHRASSTSPAGSIESKSDYNPGRFPKSPSSTAVMHGVVRNSDGSPTPKDDEVQSASSRTLSARSRSRTPTLEPSTTMSAPRRLRPQPDSRIITAPLPRNHGAKRRRIRQSAASSDSSSTDPNPQAAESQSGHGHPPNDATVVPVISCSITDPELVRMLQVTDGDNVVHQRQSESDDRSVLFLLLPHNDTPSVPQLENFAYRADRRLPTEVPDSEDEKDELDLESD